MPKSVRAPEIIGWREHISLPDLGLAFLPAKIDTGARTSALHALEQTIIDVDGVPWAEFMVPVGNRRTKRLVRAPLVGERDIKNTSSVPERRLIVRTPLLIGRHRWQIEVSLANRKKMEFDLILGRTAIRRRGILVDAGRSFILDPINRVSRIKEAGALSTPARHVEGEEE